MTWLLTGGAGYIGAHVARSLRSSGRRVVVLDDLSTGFRERLPADVPLVVASVADADVVAAVITEHQVDGVVHLAAKKAVAESVDRPLHYFQENVGGVLALLQAMEVTGTHRLVLSSSAAVYGTPAQPRVTEESPTAPESPYGETKLVSEWIVRDVAAVSRLRYLALRYFNVAGAADPALGDRGVHNLIPMVFQALSEGRRPQIFGGDYPTADGSCVRDFIHVVDLAEAHVAAAGFLEAGPARGVLNVGTGRGASVKEVMEVVRRVTGRAFDYDIAPRRPGDPACVVAAADRIGEQLGWAAREGLVGMVASAWQAWATPRTSVRALAG